MKFYMVTEVQLDVIESLLIGANVDSNTIEIIKLQMVEIKGDGP